MSVIRNFKIPYEYACGILSHNGFLFLPDFPRARPETTSELGRALVYCQHFMRASRSWDKHGAMTEIKYD